MNDLSGYIDAALDSLKLSLPGKIAAFNAEPGKPQLAVPLDPDAYYFGGDPLPMYTDVKVEVSVPDGEMDGPSVQQASFDLRPQVVVIAWVKGSGADFTGLYRQALGYGRVVREVMLIPGAWGAHITVTRVRFSYQANPETRELEAFTAGAMNFFTLEDIDQR